MGLTYIFAREGETWTEQTILQPSDDALDDNFGENVSIDGNLLVVSDPFKRSITDNSIIPRALYVFEQKPEGWQE